MNPDKLTTYIAKTPHEIIDSNTVVPKSLIIFNIFAAMVYLAWWFDFSHMGNPWLYIPLLIGEIYHVFQALGYAATIWDQSKSKKPATTGFTPLIDVFITVCGEPTDIVKKTVSAAVKMDYPNHKVYVLNDGKGRNASNWEEVSRVSEELGAVVITRDNNAGAKAGNINNALRKTTAPFIVVFDADHIPHKDFLKETIPYFSDPQMGLVQAPQFYKNKDDGFLPRASWEQQELFFGPICRGKGNSNSIFWCGTNAIVRRKALMEIGGIPENNIAEDFLASFRMHKRGWKSVYVPKILARGLAPHTLQDYVNQQFRWARGSSELIFKHNPFFTKGLSFWQRLQYVYSSSYYLNGLVVLIDILIPVIVLSTGIIPVQDADASFIILFLMFILSTFYLLASSTDNTITFAAIQLSMSSSFIFIQAVLATLFGIKSKFKVTSKEVAAGNYLKFAFPHVLYILVGIGSIILAYNRVGFNSSLITNSAWIIFNIIMFFGFIRVAYAWHLLFVPFILWWKTFVNSISRVYSRLLNPKRELIFVSNETERASKNGKRR